MAVTVRCPVCGRNFNGWKSYDDHLPCHGPKILGASGSNEVATGSKQAKEESSKTGGSGSGDN